MRLVDAELNKVGKTKKEAFEKRFGEFEIDASDLQNTDDIDPVEYLYNVLEENAKANYYSLHAGIDLIKEEKGVCVERTTKLGFCDEPRKARVYLSPISPLEGEITYKGVDDKNYRDISLSQLKCALKDLGVELLGAIDPYSTSGKARYRLVLTRKTSTQDKSLYGGSFQGCRPFFFFCKIYAYKPAKQTYLMQRNEFEKTKSYLVSRLKKIPEVKAVYLFGSYATGKEKPISDIDICVITEKNITKSKKLDILSYAGKKVEISLFYDLPISAKAKVFKEGVLLFSKDKRLLADVRLAAMKEYLDFKPTLERFTRLYTGGLRGKSR